TRSCGNVMPDRAAATVATPSPGGGAGAGATAAGAAGAAASAGAGSTGAAGAADGAGAEPNVASCWRSGDSTASAAAFLRRSTRKRHTTNQMYPATTNPTSTQVTTSTVCGFTVRSWHVGSDPWVICSAP